MSTSTPTESLLPSTKLTKKMAPPLKKTELVEALAIRKRSKMVQESKEQAALLAKKKSEFESAMNALILGSMKEHSRSHYTNTERKFENGKYGKHRVKDITLTVQFQITDPSILALARELERIKDTIVFEHNIPTLNQIKQGVRDAMAGVMGADSRVKSLLEDPASQRALDATLEKLEAAAGTGKPAVIEA